MSSMSFPKPKHEVVPIASLVMVYKQPQRLFLVARATSMVVKKLYELSLQPTSHLLELVMDSVHE